MASTLILDGIPGLLRPGIFNDVPNLEHVQLIDGSQTLLSRSVFPRNPNLTHVFIDAPLQRIERGSLPDAIQVAEIGQSQHSRCIMENAKLVCNCTPGFVGGEFGFCEPTCTEASLTKGAARFGLRDLQCVEGSANESSLVAGGPPCSALCFDVVVNVSCIAADTWEVQDFVGCDPISFTRSGTSDKSIVTFSSVGAAMLILLLILAVIIVRQRSRSKTAATFASLPTNSDEPVVKIMLDSYGDQMRTILQRQQQGNAFERLEIGRENVHLLEPLGNGTNVCFPCW